MRSLVAPFALLLAFEVSRNVDLLTNSQRPPGRGFRHLSTRLVVWVVLWSVAIQLPLAIYEARESSETVHETIRSESRYLGALTIQQIGELRRFVERGARSLADRLTDRAILGDELEAFKREVQAFVLSSSDVYGSTVAFEPFAFQKDREDFAPYFHRETNEIVAEVDRANSDYRSKDWYRVPTSTRDASWSGPYANGGGGGVAVATYSVPFFSGDRPIGVVTADLALAHLETIVAGLEVHEVGYCFILDRSGAFLFHPNGDHLRGGTVFELAKKHHSTELEQIASEMLANEEGEYRNYISVHTGKPALLTYTTDATSGWSLGLVRHQEILHAPMARLTWIRIIRGAVGALAMLAIVLTGARRITGPLRTLAKATGDIARGELGGQLPSARTVDEVGTLTHAFHAMRDNLRRHIADLKIATAAKQKLESELAIAHEIQLAMVPQSGIAVESAPRFDLAAELIPANSVGGDWFDYFLLGKDQLVIVIGDVCGKGVPAALLMARTISSIRAATRDVQTPEAILSIANQEFARDNEASMFATVFCGVLALDSGELRYASAGHEAPVMQRLDGSTEMLLVEGALPLGIVADTQYTARSRTLIAGETLVLYTDGVTEAFDPNRTAYGDERMLAAIRASTASNPALLNRAILASVRGFADGAAQSDDITLLAVTWHDER